MLKAAIIGLGSHSEVVYSILEEQNRDVIFLSYDNKLDLPSNFSYHDVYKGYVNDYILDHLDDTEYIVAIGDNKNRKIIVDNLNNFTNNQIKWMNVISEKACISKNVTIGVGNMICPGVSIQTGVKILDHCILNTNSSIDHHSKVYSYIHIAPNCAICGYSTIYDGVFLGVSTSVVPRIKIRPWFFYKAQSLVKTSNSPIPIYDLHIPNTYRSIYDAIESTWISSRGKYLDLCEEKLKTIIKTKYVVMLNNGTSATHCLFLSLKYKYPNITTIYCPNSVYVAAWNTAIYEYDIKNIKIMEIDKDTWNVDTNSDYWMSLPENIAVLIVHNIGNIVNVHRLKRIRPDIIFVEDNCEGLFGKYEDNYTASSDSVLCSSISFFANKTITSGEGGAFLTNDQDVYKYIKRKINQGNTEVRYIHDVLGYNYRMTNIQAAMLYDQLVDINSILDKKERIFGKYRLMIPEKYQQKMEHNTKHSNWMFAVRINGLENFNKAEEFFSEFGIEIRPFFYPINSHKHLSEINVSKTSKSMAELLNKECFILPSYPLLTVNEHDYIIDKFLEFSKRY